MNRHAVLLSFAAAFLFHDLSATPKADSILAFDEGVRAKFVWKRWAWCNDDYSPKTQTQAKADGCALMLFDTDEGTERTLAAGLPDCHSMRISRTGRWVTFIDANTTYIVDLTAASPGKRSLMSKSDCTYWAVKAMWIDPANGTEYLFCLDNAYYPHPGKTDMAGTSIWKVKLTSDGTADRNTAARLTINGLVNSTWAVDESFSVSADGKKLGAALPWPDTYIVDIPTGNRDLRHNGAFGCQPNLAPDNSYRFFHCLDDHSGVRMFAANMVNQNWTVSLNVNLDGSTAATDFNAPRWSNHVQYFHATWPMDNNPYCGAPDCTMDDNGSLWSKSATWVKTQINMQRVQKFYLGKFSADFKSQEKSILIASDPRYFQYGGDAWFCSGTTYGNQCDPSKTSPAIRGDHVRRGLSVAQTGAVLNIAADGGATVRITDARGRLVRQMTGSGSIVVDTRDLGIGAFFVSTNQQGKRLTRQVTIAR